METKKVEERKVEIELKFNELDQQKLKLLEQMKMFRDGIAQIVAEQTKLQGAYAEICNILGLDPKDTKNLSLQPQKVDKKVDEIDKV